MERWITGPLPPRCGSNLTNQMLKHYDKLLDLDLVTIFQGGFFGPRTQTNTLYVEKIRS